MFADNFGPEYNQSSQLNCEHLGPLAALCTMVSAFEQHHHCGDTLHLVVRNQCEWCPERHHFNLPAGAVAVYWSEQSPLSSRLMSQEPPPYLELLR